jgi:GDP-L-fucose synthase
MTTETSYSLAGKRVWVAGHTGMAGSAIVRRLSSEGCELVTCTRQEVDLRRQEEVDRWMEAHRPHAVFVAAATVGGILANATRPAEFLYDNLAIEANVIHGAWKAGVEKLVFLGSSCIYPRLAAQPMREEDLLTGPLEPTNEWYAVAKIAGIKLCQAYRRQYGCDFICAMPTNLYGQGDNYDLQTGHVAAALQAKILRAKLSKAATVEIWGSGTPRREFLYAEDLADALVFMIKHYSGEQFLNIGTGADITIRQLAELIAKVAHWDGKFIYDATKPDGMPRKVMSVEKINALGWAAKTGLEEGMSKAFAWFAQHAGRLAPELATGLDGSVQ